MTAKEYLLQIQKWRRQINSLASVHSSNIRRMREQLEMLYEQAQGLKAITYDKDRVQVSPGNKLEEIYVRIDETSEELSKAIIKETSRSRRMILALEKKIETVAEQIAGLDHSLYAELLTLMYVDGMVIRMAAAKLQIRHPDRKYDEDYIRHVHGWALKEFDRKYKISEKYHHNIT